MADTMMGLLNPAIAAIFAAIFSALWIRNRANRSVLVLGLSQSLLAIGFLVFHFTPDPNGIASTMFMHAVYCVAAGSICWAAAFRVGQKFAFTPVVAIGLVSALLMIAGSFGLDMNARFIAANTAYGLTFTLATQTLARAAERSLVDRIIIWLFAISAAQFFIRPQLAIILSGPMDAEAYRASDFYAYWMLMMGIVSLMVSLTLVAATVLDQLRSDRESAEIDPLSKLKVRRSFESAAMRMLNENLNRNVSACMIVADIDHFKRVNDIWGHQAGDEAIAAFGELIGSTVRGTDLCGRIGGEEFCILVYDCELGPAQALADRIRRKFETLEHAAIGEDIRLTASFGVSQWQPGEGYGKLFARADAALYRAKDAGRNEVAVSVDGQAVNPATPVDDTDSGSAKRVA